MDIVKFKAFHMVAALKNISKAAERLHYTQPAVSAQIRELENLYGTRLFQRVGQNLELTEAGTLLLPYAEQVLELFEQSRKRVVEAANVENQCVRVGASSLPGIHLVPGLIGAFRKNNPDMNVVLTVDDAYQVEQLLLSGEVDVGILGRAGGGHKKTRFAELLLLEDPIVAVVGREHPYAQRTSLEPCELDRQPLILPPEDRLTRRAVEKRFRQLGLEFRVAYEISYTESIKRLVINGLGISLLGRIVTAWEVECGWLQSVPINGFNVNREIFMVYPKGRAIVPAVQAFIEFVSKRFASPPSRKGLSQTG